MLNLKFCTMLDGATLYTNLNEFKIRILKDLRLQS